MARRHSALEEDGPAELREEVGRGDPAADDGLAPHPHQSHLGDVVVDDVPGRQVKYLVLMLKEVYWTLNKFLPGEVRVSLDEGVELSRHDHDPAPTALLRHGDEDEAERRERRGERAGDVREEATRRDDPACARLLQNHLDLG